MGIGLITAIEFVLKQPNLKLETQVLKLEKPIRKTIIDDLDEIEKGYEDVTDFVILNLREKIKALLEKELNVVIPDFYESNH
ncbi:MAG: hypothetical protein QNJ42_24365 [Crocosphaera sp.]|nr:hypothetical protein [Crocosphaera sp.]